MSKFELVTELYHDLGAMTQSQAEQLREIVLSEGCRDIIELGFAQGKTTAYLAALLEDAGEGSVAAFDMVRAQRRSPNIEEVLGKLGLSHRVTIYYSHRSYTWELQRLINAKDPPRFDFCYFDGGLTWDSAGFATTLVNLLLRPGGLLLLDKMNWSIDRSPHFRDNPDQARRFDEDERAAQPVRLVWDTLLPAFGYEHLREYPALGWGLARKT